MRYLIIFIFFSPLSLFAEQTGNLLSQQFFNNNQEHNGWTCTDPSHNHGNSIVAGVHGDFIENTITLGDTLNQSQINGGWTSTLGADMWSWNEHDQQIEMIQTITDASGSVTTQTRDVFISGCNGYNCGSYQTYTDNYIQGINNQSEYTIKVRFNFSESSQSTSHRAVDLKNPTLIVEHSLLNTDQVQELNTINSNFEDTVEDIQFIPIASIEEVRLAPIMQTEVYITEEISMMPIDTVEDINKGIIDVFILEEVNYDNNTQEQTFSTDFQEQEIVFETREIQEITTTQTITEETSFEEEYEPNFERGNGEQPIRESDTVALRETEVQEDPRREDESVSGRSETEPIEEPRAEENNSEEQSRSEPVTESISESESQDSSEENDRVEDDDPQDSESSTVSSEESEVLSDTDDQRVSDNTNTDQSENSENEELVSVEDMIQEVNSTIKRVDLRLIATQRILAKAMVGNLNVDSFYKSDNNVFNKRMFDGGEFYETRRYTDQRTLVAKNEGSYNDPLHVHEKKIQSINDKIKILERN
tara:strand:+ start:2898 stop:4499 length:1602 start_codon:yes stop_codon:yes gene_type:complete